MAKARANCTCATCGKMFEVTATKQNSREARRFEEWAESHITECRECEDKRIARQHDEENAKAMNEAAEKGWPELTGSEKQVAWANAIREREMQPIFDRYEKFKEIGSKFIDFDEWLLAMNTVLKNTKASWWIDNQNGITRCVDRIIRDIRENPGKYELAAQAEEAERNAKDDTATVAEPVEKKHEGIVEIRASEYAVVAEYRKDDHFRAIVKALGYSWNSAASAWRMTIGERTGSAEERATELGNKLLNAGFAIRIQDADTLRNAIEGNYQPMTYRWISRSDNGFLITWPRDDSFYERARRLPGAKYVSPGMHVPSREYETVLDFAKTYGFRLTAGAEEMVEQMRAASRVVTPAAAQDATYDEHPLSEVLESSREIIDDLKD